MYNNIIWINNNVGAIKHYSSPLVDSDHWPTLLAGVFSVSSVCSGFRNWLQKSQESIFYNWYIINTNQSSVRKMKCRKRIYLINSPCFDLLPSENSEIQKFHQNFGGAISFGEEPRFFYWKLGWIWNIL